MTMNSLGIEKPGEWLDHDPDEHCGEVLAQLLLEAAHRAKVCGYQVEDLERLLRVALPPAGE